MIAPIKPVIPNRVEKTYVASKDPHHALIKDEQDENKKEKHKNEPEDKIELSRENNDSNIKNKKKIPDSPMAGHIDISV